MKKTIKSFLQEIEDLIRWRLVWDPDTKKYKKMIVYTEDELKENARRTDK